MKIRLTEEIWKEGNMYVSYCPELDVASCGEDVEQAKKNLAESIIINIEETKKLGTFEQFLEDSGLEENIPKYKEVPVFVIKSNMRVVGMSRENYLELLLNV